MKKKTLVYINGFIILRVKFTDYGRETFGGYIVYYAQNTT